MSADVSAPPDASLVAAMSADVSAPADASLVEELKRR
jgi:hypothetical protein